MSHRSFGNRAAAAVVWVSICVLSAAPVSFAEDDAPNSKAVSSKNLEQVPGTSVSLVPPEGFTPATAFAGFQHAGAGCAIMVTEVPAPYAQVKVGVGDATMLRARGMELLEKEDLPLGKHGGLLVLVYQEAQGRKVKKWMRLFGDDDRSVLVLATAPLAMADSWMPVLKESLLSIAWGEAAELPDDVFEGLSFRLKDLAGMQPQSRLGAMVGLTPDGEADLEKKGKPLFSVGPAVSPIADRDRERVAEFTLRSTYRGAKIEATREIEIDGMKGVETLATVDDREVRRKLVIVQTMLFDAGTYWRSLGIAPNEDREVWLPKFRSMMGSFERRRVRLSDDSGRLRLVAPATWTPLEIVEDADLQIGNAIGETYLVGMIDPREDLAERTLDDVAAEFRAGFGASSESVTVKESIEVSELPAIRARVRDTEEGLTWIFVTVRGEDTHYHAIAWTKQDIFDADPGSIEDVISTLEVVGD